MPAWHPKDDYELSEYPQVGYVDFPLTIPVACAVCARSCGFTDLLADGQTLVCDRCGKRMLKRETRTYAYVGLPSPREPWEDAVAEGAWVDEVSGERWDKHGRPLKEPAGSSRSPEPETALPIATKWRLESYPPEDYPEDMEIDFPLEVHVAYAVCGRSCGEEGFIVDGQTQICEKCGKNMFRTEVRLYRLLEQAAGDTGG